MHRMPPRSGGSGAPALYLFNKTITDSDKNPLGVFFITGYVTQMNIPPEVARAQAHHGIKGAAHGSKGGRPKLDLTDDERKERRRKQHEDHRRRNGIPPKKVLPPGDYRKSWEQQYVDIWGKPPGVPLTPEEFAQREPLWNA